MDLNKLCGTKVIINDEQWCVDVCCLCVIMNLLALHSACCFVQMCIHTRKWMCKCPDLCVRSVHLPSVLCPLRRPGVARFCSNSFWQLCNFCWFIPDLGKLLFCSAGVISKERAHAHTHVHNRTAMVGVNRSPFRDQPMTTFPISLSNVDWVNGSLLSWDTSSVVY